jgi:hypothetical protein
VKKQRFFAPFETIGDRVWRAGLKANFAGEMRCCEGSVMQRQRKGSMASPGSDVGIMSAHRRIYMAQPVLAPEFCQSVAARCLKNAVFHISTGRTIKAGPPLTISDEALGEGLSVTGGGIVEIDAELKGA